MDLSCGRVRQEIGPGWNPVIERELDQLRFGLLNLELKEPHALDTGEQECGVILLQGSAEIRVLNGETYRLGPRKNVFVDKPSGLLLGREQQAEARTDGTALLAIATAPAAKSFPNQLIGPDQVDEQTRGADNWSRTVRKLIWSDNTEGNQLLVGETLTPSGNWSTVPPHRHQYDTEGEEASYDEIYFFLFSDPSGRGMIWQFDGDTGMDQAFSLQQYDAAYMSGGYHPVACMPGSGLYHLTLMSGPKRISRASLHPDYAFLLDQQNLRNQYTPKT